MKRILLLTVVLFLGLNVSVYADDEKDMLEEQIEIFEQVISDLEEKILELEKENEELRALLDGEVVESQGLIEVDDVTEIEFKTGTATYKVEDIKIVNFDTEYAEFFTGEPMLAIFYEAEVHEGGVQSNHLFGYDVQVYQESEVSYTALWEEEPYHEIKGYEEYFEHTFDNIKEGVTIKNVTLYYLENLEDPLMIEDLENEVSYTIELDEIEKIN